MGHRYEEALERARKGMPIDEVFPELKESEDERIRKTLLRCCDDWDKGQFGCMKKEDIASIRAYLERQKEQKPAEWSEEDEVEIKVLDSIIRYIVEVIDKDVLERFGTNYEELFSWLKSLRPRPHWKPSEKQMKALKNARYMMSQSGDYYDTTAIIDSLITDLQKLL